MSFHIRVYKAIEGSIDSWIDSILLEEDKIHEVFFKVAYLGYFIGYIGVELLQQYHLEE